MYVILQSDILTLGAHAHAQRGLQYLVCHYVHVHVYVCLSVTTFSAAMCNQTANKRYLRVQCHTGFIFKRAAAFETYGVKQNEGANMQISTGLHVP